MTDDNENTDVDDDSVADGSYDGNGRDLHLGGVISLLYKGWEFCRICMNFFLFVYRASVVIGLFSNCALDGLFKVQKLNLFIHMRLHKIQLSYV